MLSVLVLGGGGVCATAIGATTTAPFSGSSNAPLSQYGGGPSFCAVVAKIRIKLPNPPPGTTATSVAIYLSALESTLGVSVTVPSTVADAFLGNSASFLRRAALAASRRGTLKPFVVLRLVRRLTGAHTQTTVALAGELARLGAPRGTAGQVQVVSGRPVRIDVVETLSSGAKLRRHTLLLPCQHQTGAIDVALAGFSSPAGSAASGDGLSGAALAFVLVLGVAGLGFGSVGVRRLRRSA